MITFVLNLKPGNSRSDGIKQQQLKFEKLKSNIRYEHDYLCVKSQAGQRSLGWD